MAAIFGKKLIANICCFLLLLLYTLFGGFLFLYLEQGNSLKQRELLVRNKFICIEQILQGNESEPVLAERITQHCLLAITDPVDDRRRQVWNFRNALLFGFGILTTLGYGKIEPETIQARIFTVVWGFFGVPFTVIILTNLGLYMRRVERYIRQHYCQKRQRARTRDRLRRCCRRAIGRRRTGEEEEDDDTISINPWFYEDEETADEEEARQISPFTMAAVVFAYLAIGALVLPLLKGKFEFIDGLFYSYLCFTAIEYGHLIPENNSLVPIVLLYMCIGLAMSTIALDIGSNYVKKLYFLGKRATNVARASFFYGSKHVTVKELLSAVGQAIGVSPDALDKVDLDQMVGDAIAVKVGQLDKVPQNYMFLEGIWPPELIPLFQRDGHFPDWVDADEFRHSIRTTSSVYNNLLETTPALSLCTYADGRLHRSLHSTSSNSSSWKKDRNNNTKNNKN